MTVQNKHEFGNLLRTHRRLAGLTQEELAERAGVSARSISDLERGLKRAPYPNTVRRLADALDLGNEDRATFSAAAMAESHDTLSSETAAAALPPPAEHPGQRRTRWARLSRRRAAGVVLALMVIIAGGIPVSRIFVRSSPSRSSWVTEPDPSWGSSVFEASRLRRPMAIAAGADGDVFVADAGANRIFSFTSSGRPLRSWGGTGSAPGQLRDPQALAVDASGYIYVADTGNDRVEKFSPVGTLLSVWRFPVGDHRNLSGPDGISVDAQGYVYVSDPGHSRVELWSPDGHVAGAFGEVYSPGQLALDSGGRAYLASGVQIYTDDFANRTSTSAPTQPGTLPDTAAPAGVAADAHGNVFVADRSGPRIETFAAPRRFTRQWSAGRTSPARLKDIAGIAVGNGGDVYVTDPAGGHIARFSPSGRLLGRWGPQLSPSVGDPEGLALDHSGDVYITDALTNRLLELSAAGQFVALRGGSGSGPGKFRQPLGITLDHTGNIYIADSSNNRIERLAPDGRVSEVLGGTIRRDVLPDAAGRLSSPTDVAVDNLGRTYVADTFNKRVQVFDKQGIWKATWSHFGPLSELKTSLPAAIALGPRHDVYVADPWLGRLSVMTTRGGLLRYWRIGRARGLGTGLAVTHDDNVFLADASTGRVDIYSSTGTLLGLLSDRTGRPLRFVDPTAIAVYDERVVYVADAGRHRVLKFVLKQSKGLRSLVS